MAQINILSGRPLDEERQLRKEQQRIKGQKQIEKGVELSQDVQSQGGQILLERIRIKLQNRILELVKHDPEGQALLAILDEVGTEIKLAEAEAERITKESIRLEKPVNFE